MARPGEASCLPGVPGWAAGHEMTALPPAGGGNFYCLKLDGPMIHERRQELERMIIDAMRRHRCLRADLSAVREIDSYGVRLLALLQSVGTIVAASPAVTEAAERSQQSPGKPCRRRDWTRRPRTGS